MYVVSKWHFLLHKCKNYQNFIISSSFVENFEEIIIVIKGLFGFKEVGGSEEVSFLTYVVHPNTGKRK